MVSSIFLCICLVIGQVCYVVVISFSNLMLYSSIFLLCFCFPHPCYVLFLLHIWLFILALGIKDEILNQLGSIFN